MRCPHLVKDVVYTCGSGEGPSFPGSKALKKYCKNDGFCKCPHFMARAMSWSFPGLDAAA